jgi:5,5'-dehydrodivanillate O-demethylase oxygenase subunit
MPLKKVNISDLERIDEESIAGKYLREEFWHPVSTSNSLACGQAKPVELLGTSLTLYRGTSGNIHAVGSHCPHRLTKLSTGFVEQDSLRCLYHGWKFSYDGQCVEQPLNSKQKVPNVCIPSYKTVEYLGLIFIYLGSSNLPPPLPHFPLFERQGILISAYMSDWQCNFFVMIEGSTDWGHTVYTHHRSGLSNLLPNNFSFESIENEYGILTNDTSDEYALLTGSTQFYMPNINFFDVPFDRNREVVCLIWRVPINNSKVSNFLVAYSNGDVSSEEIILQLGINQNLTPSTTQMGDLILSGIKTLDDLDVINRTDLIQIEDYVAQKGQLAPSVSTKCLLTYADSGIIAMRSIWLRELSLYTNQQALKKWQHYSRNEIK